MSLSPTVIWLVIGVVLCLFDVVLPTAFVASVMGISALLVAAVAVWLPVNWQIILWVFLSIGMVWLSRRLVPKGTPMKLDATEAETLTEILPGKTGRVIYEGSSWAARCDDFKVAIAPQQRVYVVGRRGTTLIVVPEHLVHS
ncbi:MAG: NfeD family protein [Scytolyngbya sp. HA4215-MV1]|jgi:membrane protein implicated in regulation of membrane protease activity|nr:NfeD family protein [Scytolyngbya sp. HA4215-MV1]